MSSGKINIQWIDEKKKIDSKWEAFKFINNENNKNLEEYAKEIDFYRSNPSELATIVALLKSYKDSMDFFMPTLLNIINAKNWNFDAGQNYSVSKFKKNIRKIRAIFYDFKNNKKRSPETRIGWSSRFNEIINVLEFYGTNKPSSEFWERKKKFRSATTRYAKQEWDSILSGINNEYMKKLGPHGGHGHDVRIFVMLGGGGVGDILMFTPYISALKQQFQNCEITVATQHKISEEVFSGNEDVRSVVTMNWECLQRSVAILRRIDVYDLIVYMPCFIPHITFGKNSRISENIDAKYILPNQRNSELLLPFCGNSGISALDKLLKINFLDLLGKVTQLNIDKFSSLKFSPDPSAAKVVDQLNLRKYPYVTVRDGSNAGDTRLAREKGKERTNKQISRHQWIDIVEKLTASGIKVIQVGSPEENRIPGISLDLRGETTFSELCFIMKNSICHIDTEGGLVHFARACNVASIAIYGATSADFFAYPGNYNLDSSKCDSCWYTHENWLTTCISEDNGEKLCTKNISGELILSVLDKTFKSRHHNNWTLEDIHMVQLVKCRPDEDDFLKKIEKSIDLVGKKSVLIEPPGYNTLLTLHDENMHVDRVICNGVFDTRSCAYNFIEFNDGVRKIEEISINGSIFNIPLNDGVYDVVVLREIFPGSTYKREIFREIKRLTKINGAVVVAFDASVFSEDYDPQKMFCDFGIDNIEENINLEVLNNASDFMCCAIFRKCS